VRNRVTVDGVIAVVDGPAAAAGRFADDLEAINKQRAADGALDHESPIAELFEDQINCADLIVLNKNDQMDDAARGLASALIVKEMKRAAKVVPASFGNIDPGVLLGLPAALLAMRGDARSTQAAAATDRPPEPGMSLGQAVRTLAFWQISIGILASAAALGGMLNQLSPVLADRGRHHVLRRRGLV